MPATTGPLTPEQRTAIKVLQDCLPNWNQYYCEDLTQSEICYTDYKAFTPHKLSYSDLQHGTDWTWNQSNAKKEVLLENDIYVVIQKFNTRKKRKCASNGLIFKLWMFSVFRYTDSTFLGIFVWCEKGNPSPPETTIVDETLYSELIASQKQVNTSITLQDLEFLRPFVDEATATSLGWM